MAPLAKHVSFFLLSVLISSLHIEARGGKFLTKTTYNYAPEPEPLGPTLAPSISSAPASAPIEGGIGYAPTPVPGGIGYAPTPVPGEIGYAPGPVESDHDNLYGLYGRKTTTATTIGNEEDEILDDEIASERLGEYNAGNHYSNNNYNNDRYSNNYYYNNHGYSNSGYNYNKGHANSYYNNGYENNEQKGMSDTRFLENGKYYYDVNNENQDHDKMNGYEYSAAKENSHTEGYYGYGEKSKYEFDTMEEYERQQGYPDTDRLYDP